MKRSWTVLVALAVAALGCRSSQPATNPFLRTTVPPPATGAGAVVVPGEQYYPAGAAPLTTAPPAITTAPPPITTTAPPPMITSPAMTTPGGAPADRDTDAATVRATSRGATA